MEYFLQHIARSLYSEFGNTLNRHCLVFPNRRAGLFFLKYLAAEIKQPVWTPSTITINDLFRSMSALKLAENEILLFELYKVYRAVRKSSEGFDEFYFWGAEWWYWLKEKKSYPAVWDEGKKLFSEQQ